MLLNIQVIKELYENKHSGEINRYYTYAKDDVMFNFLFSIVLYNSIECEFEDYILKMLESEKLCQFIVHLYTNIQLSVDDIKNIKAKAKVFLDKRKYNLFKTSNMYKKIILFLMEVEKTHEMICNEDSDFIVEIFDNLSDQAKKSVLKGDATPIKILLYSSEMYDDVFAETGNYVFYRFLRNGGENFSEEEMDFVKNKMIESNYTYIKDKLFVFYKEFPELKTIDRKMLGEKEIDLYALKMDVKTLVTYTNRCVIEKYCKKDKNELIPNIGNTDFKKEEVALKKYYMLKILSEEKCILLKKVVNDWFYEYFMTKDKELFEMFLNEVYTKYLHKTKEIVDNLPVLQLVFDEILDFTISQPGSKENKDLFVLCQDLFLKYPKKQFLNTIKKSNYYIPREVYNKINSCV